MFLKWSSVKAPVLAIAMVVLLALPLAGVAAAADPTNGITAPAEGAKVSGTVKVMGYANDPNFNKWQLDLLSGGDAAKPLFLAVGTTPGEFTYSLDTTAYPAGAHALRLRIVRPDGNYQELVTNFTIAAPVTLQSALPRDPGSVQTVTTTTATGMTTATTPTNGITAPAEGAKVSGTVKVMGYANDPNFNKWQLDLLSGGDAAKPLFLAVGTTPGNFTYALDTTAYPAGAHALRLRIVRPDGNYQELVTNFTIAAPVTLQSALPRDPGSVQTVTATTTTATAPANGITAPAEGATVSGTVKVMGYANDPNFNKWQLDLLPGGDATKPLFLAVGNTPGAFTYSLDTAAYPAGAHALRLRIVRPDGNYQEHVTNFTIAR